MSSTITQSEKCITETCITEDKDNKTILRLRKSIVQPQHAKFVRSASIEKIIKFNAFICSQNFYILPALLSWLKTSQSNIQPSLEKGLVTLKFYLFTTYLYSAVLNKLYEAKESAKIIAVDLVKIVQTPEASRKMLSVIVYLTLISIAFELVWCIYMLAYAMLPSGLAFLCCSIYAICHVNMTICTEFIAKQAKQEEIDAKPKLNARKILGDRTISNFNLFYHTNSKMD